jgi:hypothetical protein
LVAIIIGEPAPTAIMYSDQKKQRIFAILCFFYAIILS